MGEVEMSDFVDGFNSGLYMAYEMCIFIMQSFNLKTIGTVVAILGVPLLVIITLYIVCYLIWGSE